MIHVLVIRRRAMGVLSSICIVFPPHLPKDTYESHRIDYGTVHVLRAKPAVLPPCDACNMCKDNYSSGVSSSAACPCMVLRHVVCKNESISARLVSSP